MNRQVIIERTLDKIKKFPDSKLKEINDFADFLLSRLDDSIILDNIQNYTANSKSFEFLNDEEYLYDENDLKESYK